MLYITIQTFHVLDIFRKHLILIVSEMWHSQNLPICSVIVSNDERLWFLKGYHHFFIPLSIANIESSEDSSFDAASSRSGYLERRLKSLQTKKYPNLPITDFSTVWPLALSSETTVELLTIRSTESLNFPVTRKRIPVFLFSELRFLCLRFLRLHKYRLFCFYIKYIMPSYLTLYVNIALFFF